MTKYDALFEDENDIFGGTPKSKYWDIYSQSSPETQKHEFEIIVERIAAMEGMLKEYIDEENLDRRVQQYLLQNSTEVEAYKKSIYMELAGKLIYALDS